MYHRNWNSGSSNVVCIQHYWPLKELMVSKCHDIFSSRRQEQNPLLLFLPFLLQSQVLGYVFIYVRLLNHSNLSSLTIYSLSILICLTGNEHVNGNDFCLHTLSINAISLLSVFINTRYTALSKCGMWFYLMRCNTFLMVKQYQHFETFAAELFSCCQHN